MATQEDLKKYELLLIFSPEMPASAFEKEVSEFKSFLKEHAKGVFFDDVWGLKTLAYRVKKHAEGYFAILYFNAEPSQILEVSTNARLNTRLLRHMLVSLPDDYEARKWTEEELSTKAPARVFKKPMRTKKSYDVSSPPQEIVTTSSEEKPLLSGKTGEEKLKSVEKTLESILDNPDINI